MQPSARGGTWNNHGEIVFGTRTTGLFRVPASGGTLTALTNLTSRENQKFAANHRFPVFLPDNEHIAYVVQSPLSAQVQPCIDIVFINDDPPVVVGPWTDPFVVRFPAGTSIFGARLHPGRAPGILGIPAAELLNQSVPLSEVWSSTNSARFTLALDEPMLVSQQSVFAGALVRATASATPPDSAVVASIRWLARHPHGRVEQLSQWIGISHRQLQRRFSAAVGYGPKMFQSVLRFQRLLNFASRPTSPVSLADLGAVAGYADQAHMTREVRRFAGCTPMALIPSAACTLRMSDLFKTDPPVSN